MARTTKRKSTGTEVENDSKKAKTEKAMSFKTFEEGVKPLEMVIRGGKKELDIAVLPKEFSTKSYGFGANARMIIEAVIDGEVQDLEAIVSINVTIKGSKHAAEAAAEENEEESE